jgi:hypothetical protein
MPGQRRHNVLYSARGLRTPAGLRHARFGLASITAFNSHQTSRQNARVLGMEKTKSGHR